MEKARDTGAVRDCPSPLQPFLLSTFLFAMLLPRPLPLLAFVALALAANRPARRDHAAFDYYVLEHDSFSSASIYEVSEALGLNVVEPLGELAGHWLLSLPRTDAVRRDGVDPVLHALQRLRATARSPSSAAHQVRSAQLSHAKRIVESVSFVERQVLRKRTKRVQPESRDFYRGPEVDDPTKTTNSSLVATRFNIKDPGFAEQWHIINDAHPQHMMNVTPAWAQGITGKGVTVAMVDDGIDFESEDIAPNFVRRLLAI